MEQGGWASPQVPEQGAGRAKTGIPLQTAWHHLHTLSVAPRLRGALLRLCFDPKSATQKETLLGNSYLAPVSQVNGHFQIWTWTQDKPG